MDDLKTGRCDFCSCEPPMPGEWAYPCDDFFDEKSGTNMLQEWVACGECSRLIEAGDLKGLVERATATYLQYHASNERRFEQQVKNHIYMIHTKFWNHRKGGRKPWLGKVLH